MSLGQNLVDATIACLLVLDWRLGARPERAAVLILGITNVFDLVYHATYGEARYASIDLGHLGENVACNIAFLVLALRANRIWTLWCCALQLMMAMGHVGEFVYPHGSPYAYWAMTAIPTVGQMVALTAGAVAHHRRQRKVGIYRDWRLA